MFADTITVDSTIPALMKDLHTHQEYFKQLSTTYPLEHNGHLWFYHKRIVIPKENELRWGVISLFHDSTTAGHPGTLRTRLAIKKDY